MVKRWSSFHSNLVRDDDDRGCPLLPGHSMLMMRWSFAFRGSCTVGDVASFLFRCVVVWMSVFGC